MHHVSLDDMASRMGPSDVIYALTDALGATDMALNYYEVDPGESLAYGFHAHERQEEIFYVTAGTATFETRDGDVEVAEHELVRFGPGEFQRGWNHGDDRLELLAMGAPQDSGDTEILRDCDTCGETTRVTLELTDDQDAVLVRCLECETEIDRYH